MYDFHTHFIPQNVLDWLKENKKTVHTKWEQKYKNKHEFLIVNGKWGFELKPAFYDFEIFEFQKTKIGVTHSIISPIPQLFMYEFSTDITTEISQVYNYSLIELIRKSPNTISALGTVPLNNPEQAGYILNDVMNKGLKGVIIGPGINNKLLSDEFFTPFLEEANTLKAILFIHPLINTDPRIKLRKMPNLIGVPWETTITATDIVLSGLLDKFPNIRILLAHGGGFLPYQLDRLDKGYSQWKEIYTNLNAPPSEYVKRFWYDTVLSNSHSLDFLIKAVGEDKIVSGSDFPFDLSDWPPQVINERGALSLLGFSKTDQI